MGPVGEGGPKDQIRIPEGGRIKKEKNFFQLRGVSNGGTVLPVGLRKVSDQLNYFKGGGRGGPLGTQQTAVEITVETGRQPTDQKKVDPRAGSWSRKEKKLPFGGGGGALRAGAFGSKKSWGGGEHDAYVGEKTTHERELVQPLGPGEANCENLVRQKKFALKPNEHQKSIKNPNGNPRRGFGNTRISYNPEIVVM